MEAAETYLYLNTLRFERDDFVMTEEALNGILAVDIITSGFIATNHGRSG